MKIQFRTKTLDFLEKYTFFGEDNKYISFWTGKKGSGFFLNHFWEKLKLGNLFIADFWERIFGEKFHFLGKRLILRNYFSRK